MPDSGDMTPAELGRTVKRLEVRVEDGFKKTDSGLEHLQAMILALSTTYVRLDLYLSERDTMRNDIETAKKIAMWSLGAIASVVIGAIVVAMVGASGIGR